MKQNKLYLIKRLEKRIEELEERSRELYNYGDKCDRMGKRMESLEKLVKEILYAIGR